MDWRRLVRESEREGRQKGLAANPVHGQSWRSFIVLPERCRRNSYWITPLYFIALSKSASAFFFCSDCFRWLSKGFTSWVHREQRTKKPGDKAWGQDVLWTVWCHTWINLFSGRLCMAADALFFVCSDTKEDKWRTAQWIRHLRPSQNKHLMPVSNIGNAAVLNFSCIFWVFTERAWKLVNLKQDKAHWPIKAKDWQFPFSDSECLHFITACPVCMQCSWVAKVRLETTDDLSNTSGTHSSVCLKFRLI